MNKIAFRLAHLDPEGLPGKPPDEKQGCCYLEYDVEPEKRSRFLEVIRKCGRIRRRDGAYRWGVFRDAENWDRDVKTFLVVSLAEHLRQLERLTLADRNT